MDYVSLKDYLVSIGDKKLAEFTKPLLHSDYKVIGIYQPDLKRIVKEHAFDEDLRVEEFELGEYFEIDYLYFAFSLKRLLTLEEQLSFLKKQIRLAKSWAITDSVPSFLKKMDFAHFQSFFKSSYQSKFTFERRMAYVLGLKFYKDERILKLLPSFGKAEEYMVMMAEAWLLSCIAIRFEDEVYAYLSGCDGLVLKRKAISKILDSRRFNEESKSRFKSLRG